MQLNDTVPYPRENLYNTDHVGIPTLTMWRVSLIHKNNYVLFYCNSKKYLMNLIDERIKSTKTFPNIVLFP